MMSDLGRGSTQPAGAAPVAAGPPPPPPPMARRSAPLKHPDPPHQALLMARDAVVQLMESRKTQAEEAGRIVKAWRDEVKIWEERDTLDKAFIEGRLTFRTMSHILAKDEDYNYSDLRPSGDATQKRLHQLINNDKYKKGVPYEAQRGPEGVWVPGKDLEDVGTLINAGGAGILKRVTPANFERRESQSHSAKSSLGLHSLSAHLLRPDLRLKYYDGVCLVVLMPLPLPEDVSIFYRLRQLSKQPGCGIQFSAAVAILATQFTRPQLAANLDMGTSYARASSDRGGHSIKYVKGTGATSLESEQACRDNAVRNYRTIVERPAPEQNVGADGRRMYCANEITVAYRQWGLTGTNFPVFGISLSGTSPFLIKVELLLPVEARTSAQHFNVNYRRTGTLISKDNYTARDDPEGRTRTF